MFGCNVLVKRYQRLDGDEFFGVNICVKEVINYDARISLKEGMFHNIAAGHIEGIILQVLCSYNPITWICKELQRYSGCGGH